MVAHDDQHIPLERWVGRQLGEISRGAADAREAVTRDGERAALVIGHVLAHGRHEPGACGTCDAGRAWLEEWLAGRADAPEALAEVERVADMGAAEYARHWRRRTKGAERGEREGGAGCSGSRQGCHVMTPTEVRTIAETIRKLWNKKRVAKEVGVSQSMYDRLRAKGEGPPVALWLTPRIPLWDPEEVRAWAITRGGTVLKRFSIPKVPSAQPVSALPLRVLPAIEQQPEPPPPPPDAA